jgi:hypothetical protein
VPFNVAGSAKCWRRGSDGECPGKHQVGGVIFSPDDAIAQVHPSDGECCHERNADGGSVRGLSVILAASSQVLPAETSVVPTVVKSVTS